jgi:hypothetical protein
MLERSGRDRLRLDRTQMADPEADPPAAEVAAAEVLALEQAGLHLLGAEDRRLPELVSTAGIQRGHIGDHTAVALGQPERVVLELAEMGSPEVPDRDSQGSRPVDRKGYTRRVESLVDTAGIADIAERVL